MTNYYKYTMFNITHNNNNNKQIFDNEPAEVIDIILDETHPLYNNPNDIGTIIFRRISSDFDKRFNELPRAKPLNPNIKQYPVRYEIVLITKSISQIANTYDKNITYYYTQITNVWNKISHNAMPFTGISNQIETQNNLTNFKGKNNQKTYGYLPNNKKQNIILGNYFYENNNIHDLIPFEGDFLILSRFGSSIRFTYNTNPNTKNFWSKDTKNKGKPIIIIRNTSIEKKINENFSIEDINNDDNIIIISSGGYFPLKINSKENEGYITEYKPEKINKYNSNQIIVNTDRIIFNTKKDNILFFSEKSIYNSAKNSIILYSNNYINLKSNNIYTNSKKLFLNTNNESQPAVLGNELVNLLIKIIDNILQMTFNTPLGPTLNMNPPALTNFIELKTKLQTLKPILSKSIFLS